MSWANTTLGNVCQVITKGTTPTSYGFEFTKSGVPFIRVNDFPEGKLCLSEQTLFVAPSTNQKYSRSIIRSGDVLLSIAGTIGRSCVVPNGLPEMNCNQAVCIIRANQKILDQNFLNYWLRSNDAKRQMIQGKVTGVISNFNLTLARQLEIPLPPLSEQKRIAEILDRAEALRAKRRAALALLDELTQSIFLDMFGDAEVHGSRWPVRKIADYVAEFQGGNSLESTDDNGSQRRVLKVSAVTGMKFRPHESKPIDDDYKPSDEHYVRNGDLLFSRANTTELVGAVAYVSNCPQNLLLPDKLWRFVWKDKKTVHPLFIWYLFQTRPVRREIGNRATGTSGSMKNISKAKLFGIPTIFPPFELQQTFADRSTAIEQLQDRLKPSLLELDQLFAALQHRAFRGEL